MNFKIKKLNLCFLVLSLLVFPIILNAAESLDEAQIPKVESTLESKVSPEEAEEKVSPDPQRLYCINYWNEYYKRMKKANITVSTKGEQDEIVVFSCPDCSLEEHYVEPFLNTEVEGITGIDRIRECGFTQAVFKGSKGLREIVREVN
ncbi:MAG: hypothetical protein ACRENO_04060 [Thermodesulfobacteriota bacterium]